MSVEEFEIWVESLELMSNPKAVKTLGKGLEKGLKEAKSRKVALFKEVFGEKQ